MQTEIEKHICYCCLHEENEGKYINETNVDLSHFTGTNIEVRWVCNNCHQIDEINKLPNLEETK